MKGITGDCKHELSLIRGIWGLYDGVSDVKVELSLASIHYAPRHEDILGVEVWLNHS
jgi:hypothetical protein